MTNSDENRPPTPGSRPSTPDPVPPTPDPGLPTPDTAPPTPDPGPQTLILTTGGTIDKIYFDAKSDYTVGEPQIGEILREANVTASYSIEPLFSKDSLDLSDTDRNLILERIRQDSCTRILITHGTDTMAETARVLRKIEGKTIVLVGSLSPARFKNSDAVFNIGFSMAAVQTLPAGVYIAMNGCIFDAQNVRKNLEENRFELIG